VDFSAANNFSESLPELIDQNKPVFEQPKKWPEKLGNALSHALLMSRFE